MSILLKNATFLDWKTGQIEEASVLVRSGKVELFRTPPSLPELGGSEKGTDVQIVDCTGKLVTRSFGCGHHHIYSALARGMPAPPKNPNNFTEILQYVWWRLDKSLDPETIKISALVTALYCIKNGVTMIIDHHASPNAVKGSLHIIADALEEAGLSHLLCYELSDRDGPESRQQGLDETADYLEHRPGLVGLHASFTVGNDLLKEAVQLASKSNTGIHIHVAEDKVDQIDSEQKYNCRVVERLNSAGALENPRTILAHCLHLTDREWQTIDKSGVWVAENMESNLNNAVGIFDARGIGKNIMFGTDGMHSDMLRSAKAAFFTSQTFEGMDFEEMYRRFRNIHHYIDQNFATNSAGDTIPKSLQAAGEDSLVILDYDSPSEVSSENFLGHLVFGIESRHVESLIAGGKFVMKDHRVLTIDEETLLPEAKKAASKLWKKMEAQI